MSKLGAFGSELGALACYFDSPWKHVSPSLSVEEGWILSNAAFALRALGRLVEAQDPMRLVILRSVREKDWENAAVNTSTLSELELDLGEVARAIVDAEQAVSYADTSGSLFQRLARRTTHANALHHAGRKDEAEMLFREAEQMQKKSDPDRPILHTLSSFHYCDLLLGSAERAAWQRFLQCSDYSTDQVPQLRKISQRAATTLEWVTGKYGPLYEGLDHLTLSRAALYEALLSSQGSLLNIETWRVESPLNTAVDSLRRSGDMVELPRGLLTRAWLRRVTAAVSTGPGSAKADLDEAWEIAERGPMRLHMADIHLYRARLFFREKKYPWESPEADLKAAEKLINDCGYHRRDEELADAKRIILNQSV